ncbi:MAG: ATP synthase F1 subunit epsilon [Pseudobdellovibrionaceae bacterium]
MFKLTLVTPEKRIVLDQEIDDVTVPAFKGELNILPGHAPLITTLETGILRYKLKGEPEQKVAISWGYCQVSPLGVNILAEYAAVPMELQIEDLKKALAAAESKLSTESLNEEQWAEAQREVAKARTGMEIFPGTWS